MRRPKGTTEGPPKTAAQMKAELSRAVEGIKTEVAKCAVMGDTLRADASAAGPMLSALQQKTIALCAVLSDLQVITF
jgi:hypothetical protein